MSHHCSYVGGGGGLVQKLDEGGEGSTLYKTGDRVGYYYIVLVLDGLNIRCGGSNDNDDDYDNNL